MSINIIWCFHTSIGTDKFCRYFKKLQKGGINDSQFNLLIVFEYILIDKCQVKKNVVSA